MKISIILAENIIKRINNLYYYEIIPNNIQISEFDDPQTVIKEHFQKWVSYFKQYELLQEQSVIIKNTVDEAYHKLKLNQDYNTLTKINKHLVTFELLSNYSPIEHKNKILGKLSKNGKSESTDTILTSSIFSNDSIDEFKSQVQTLKTQHHAVLESINNKKHKYTVELDDDTVHVLQENHLIQ